MSVVQAVFTVVIVFVIIGIVGFLAEHYYKSQEEYQRVYEQRLLQSGIHEIDQMSGQQFEQRMALHFNSIGWGVELTPASGDYGADLILYAPNGQKLVAQLKRYSNTVGISAVQEVIAAITYYGADQGIIITNSHLTKNARELALKSGLEIWERELLIEHLAMIQGNSL